MAEYYEDYPGGSYNPGGDPYEEPGGGTPPPSQANPNAWLYDQNADPSGFPPLPNGWQWVWNGNQWTSNHNAGGPSGPTSPVVPPAPSVGGDYRPPGQGGGGGFGYLTEPFTGRPPAWQNWSMSGAPSIVKPPPFAYKQFEAPTKDGIYSDPSYQFRLGEGQRALEQSAAGKGVLRTGGTMKNLLNYGQNAASQEYSNIFGRAVDTHNLGLSQELGTYGTNWGVSRDVLDREIDIWGAQNTAAQRQNEQFNQHEFNNFLAEFDIFNSNRKRAGDYLFQGAGLGNP